MQEDCKFLSRLLEGLLAMNSKAIEDIISLRVSVPQRVAELNNHKAGCTKCQQAVRKIRDKGTDLANMILDNCNFGN